LRRYRHTDIDERAEGEEPHVVCCLYYLLVGTG
jgi:hypothetical protein